MPERAIMHDDGPSPVEYARRFYYDSLVFDRRALRYLIDLLGSDRLLVGSDFPAMLARGAGRAHAALHGPAPGCARGHHLEQRVPVARDQPAAADPGANPARPRPSRTRTAGCRRAAAASRWPGCGASTRVIAPDAAVSMFASDQRLGPLGLDHHADRRGHPAELVVDRHRDHQVGQRDPPPGDREPHLPDLGQLAQQLGRVGDGQRGEPLQRALQHPLLQLPVGEREQDQAGAGGVHRPAVTHPAVGRVRGAGPDRLHVDDLHPVAHAQVHVAAGPVMQLVQVRERRLAQPQPARRQGGQLQQPQPDRVPAARAALQRPPPLQLAHQPVRRGQAQPGPPRDLAQRQRPLPRAEGVQHRQQPTGRVGPRGPGLGCTGASRDSRMLDPLVDRAVRVGVLAVSCWGAAGFTGNAGCPAVIQIMLTRGGWICKK